MQSTKEMLWFVCALAFLGGAVGLHLTLRGTHLYPRERVWTVPGGDADRGRALIRSYGCGSCHTVAGVRGAVGRVGPALVGYREQLYVAGVLPNTPPNLAAWIQNPRAVNPQTAMPNLGVSEPEARDMAAYLYGLE